jgi:hypothetical protein
MTGAEIAALLLAATDGAEPVSPVGSGRVTGGWGYVWASWGLTWAMMIGYALFLWVRRPGGSPDGGDEP